MGRFALLFHLVQAFVHPLELPQNLFLDFYRLVFPGHWWGTIVRVTYATPTVSVTVLLCGGPMSPLCCFGVDSSRSVCLARFFPFVDVLGAAKSSRSLSRNSLSRRSS